MYSHLKQITDEKDQAATPSVVNDTGEELVTHKSGAKRSSDVDSFRIDLIPCGPLMRVARVLATGAKTHGTHNWRKGTSWSVCINHGLNHFYKYLSGDKSCDHLAHAICNLLFLMEYETTHPEMNDLYVYDNASSQGVFDAKS